MEPSQKKGLWGKYMREGHQNIQVSGEGICAVEEDKSCMELTTSIYEKGSVVWKE